MKLTRIWQLVRTTVSDWLADDAARLAAAMAYYAAISIAPIFVIIITVVGFLFREQTARQQLVTQLQHWIGQAGAQFLELVLRHASVPTLSNAASLISVVVLIWGSTNLFSQLQNALNVIWDVEAENSEGLMARAKDRLLSFALVLGIGLLLIIAIFLSALLATVTRYLGNLLPGLGWLWQIGNYVISFGVITLLFATIFKVLPDADIAWHDVWVGAAATAFLFLLGNFLLSFYLSHQNNAVYGAASSLVIFLLWVYYSAQIFFFGAEFTQVYANHYGSGIDPLKKAPQAS